MANRRMFSKAIIKTDNFLEMPQTAQNLYFHLGIEADDDGFVTPKMVMRTLGNNEDDLKVLIAKDFVMPFESGVIVIRHWKENNYIQSDRYRPTIWQKEYKLACGDNVYSLDTQIRLGRGRLDKRREELSSKLKPYFKGMEMRESQNKWWCLPGDGGKWLEFTGKKSEIQWR